MITGKDPRRRGSEGTAVSPPALPGNCGLSDQPRFVTMRRSGRSPVASSARHGCCGGAGYIFALSRWGGGCGSPMGHRRGCTGRLSSGAAPREDPCVLVVEFRLRAVRGWAHAAFRWESLLNTPLFVGFPGFVSKLWLANDERGRYRGLYEWDGPQRADHYARALWRVLALVSVPGSIHYLMLPGLRRDEFLARPQVLAGAAAPDSAAWWRPVEVS